MPHSHSHSLAFNAPVYSMRANSPIDLLERLCQAHRQISVLHIRGLSEYLHISEYVVAEWFHARSKYRESVCSNAESAQALTRLNQISEAIECMIDSPECQLYRPMNGCALDAGHTDMQAENADESRRTETADRSVFDMFRRKLPTNWMRGLGVCSSHRRSKNHVQHIPYIRGGMLPPQHTMPPPSAPPSNGWSGREERSSVPSKPSSYSHRMSIKYLLNPPD